MNNHSRNISAVRWFSGFAVFLAVLSLALYWAYSTGRQSLAHLIFFIGYVSLACQFCPLNIIWIFIWIAREYNPFLIALIGAFATGVANLHDYYVLNSLLKLDKLGKAKESHWYKRWAGWFSRCPFWTLVVANFLPLPIDVPRLLAISTGYSRIPFTAATLLGRYPRYLILTILGYEYKPSIRTIVIILIVTGGIPLAIKLFHKLTRPSHKTTNP
jgi:membrane protein YqaA with SNARE-associated domain